MTKYEDFKGRVFGHWTALEKVPGHWVCRCVCGVVRKVETANLKHGNSTNCGCKRKHRTKHGAARRGKKTRTYRQWKAMRSRCRPNAHDKHNYAERGISVCPRWDDFSAFLEDMGECPDGLTLDRIDNDKGYSPDNCRWADMKIQRINQRRVSWVNVDGVTMTVQDAAHSVGVHPAAIWNEKRRNGGSVQDATDRVVARNR